MENRTISHLQKRIKEAKIKKREAVDFNNNLITDSVVDKYLAQYNEGYWAGSLTAYEEMLEFELDGEERLMEIQEQFGKLATEY